MKAATIFNAYRGAEISKERAVIARNGNVCGIMVNDDAPARTYQRRWRQQRVFAAAIVQALTNGK